MVVSNLGQISSSGTAMRIESRPAATLTRRDYLRLEALTGSSCQKGMDVHNATRRHAERRTFARATTSASEPAMNASLYDASISFSDGRMEPDP
jgi:hypothetical protein